MTKTPTHNVTIGTIYRAHWGYEQTNVDYYEVVNTTPKTVVLRPIAQHLIEVTGHMSARVAPNPGEYTGPEFRRRITGGDRSAIRVNTVFNAYPWTGEANRTTSYH
jgi:hypothetical protein